MPAGTGSTRAVVVGLGTIAPRHLEALTTLPGRELVGVCDLDAGKVAAVSAATGATGSTDLEALLRATHPDVVHVCTPHAAHPGIARQALDAGAHVLTEKPLAASAAEARRLAAEVAGSSLQVGVCFQNRYNVTSQRLRAALAGREFGQVLGARGGVWWHRDAHYYAAAPWRAHWAEAGGGVLINQAIHTLDLLVWLLGAPTDVTGAAANGGIPVDGVPGLRIEVEDTAVVCLTHGGAAGVDAGVPSTLVATNHHPTNAPVLLEVTTDAGLLRLDAGELRWLPVDGSESELLASEPTVAGVRSYWGDSHRLLIDDFHQRLGDTDPFWIGPDAAVVCQDVLSAVYRQSGLPG